MPLNALLPATRRLLSADLAAATANGCADAFVRSFSGCSRVPSTPEWPPLYRRTSVRFFGPNCLIGSSRSCHNKRNQWYSTSERRIKAKERVSPPKESAIVIRHKGWSSERWRWKEIPLKWKWTVPSGSKRETKKRFRSPNEFLIRILGKRLQAWRIPRVVSGKANLSYANHRSPHVRAHPHYAHPFELFRPSLQFYLARYLKEVCRKKRLRWNTPVASKVRTWLRRQGYTEDDFRIWGKILAAETPMKAADILLHGKVDNLAISKPIPVWVTSLLCRRMDFSAPAVRRLLVYVESHMVVGPDRSDSAFESAVTTDEKTFFLICIRLLRKARIGHPESIEHIANLVVTRINPLHIGTIREEPSDRRRNEERLSKRRTHLTLLYNRMLSLLSLPTSLRPYISAALQLRAQFAILRRMSEYLPPLLITQMGYRSVARVQLAHLKTKEERKWAELKSASWPPWKEDRTAMDSAIGPDDGISRAGKSILRMHEAGYPSYNWDKIILLFAGWDSDGSPVIQNRFIVPRIQNALASALNEERMPDEFSCFRDIDHEVWAARVRTTRTLEESWAIFLAYDGMKVRRVQHRITVYLALFERIVGARKLEAQSRRNLRTLPESKGKRKEELPGDKREALPTPDSPHERLDPRLQPPSVDELFERMISSGIYLNNKCLAYLIQTAQDFGRALEYIEASRDKRVHALLQLSVNAEQIRAVPEVVFNSYIDLLAKKFSKVDKYHKRGHGLSGDGRPLIHRAIELMDLRESRYRPGWNRILLAIHNFDVRRNGTGTTELMRQTLKVLDRAGVELDSEGFRVVCRSFRFNAAVREDRIAKQGEESIQAAWEDHLYHNETDSRFLRALFNKIVGLDDLPHLRSYQKSAINHEAIQSVSLFLSVPAPTVLHDYIRALATMGDYEGVLSVATFIRDNFAGLLHHCDNELNGQLRLRRLIISMRVFLERKFELQPVEQRAVPNEGCEGQDSDDAAQCESRPRATRLEPAPEELIMLVREMVESLPRGFGSWPSDEEVEDYVQFGKDARSCINNAFMSRRP